ncbi:iron ABC transporter permease [Paenibacillus hemerocallicola]|uniref:Iron ABC transporter permease n=1 Tax=Paenibacillus hemerocallicola TaxID=1172614 RepID=A0A5C4SZ00_9BACL|nr:iron ABC transporter permease [Paenibacillus hemerocallicola]
MNRLMSFHARNVRALLSIRYKPAAIVLMLLIGCLLTSIVSIGLGEMRISPVNVVRGVIGIGGDDYTLVIRKLRLPRVAVALLAGASLAAAGAILQGMIRNPLASPDILGVTGGASVAAIAFMNYLLGTVTIRLLPAAAMLGGIIVAGLLYALAWKRGVTPMRLVLVGVGVSALMSGMTTMLLLFNPRNEASQAYFWLTGSVYGANWEHVLTLLPWTALLLPWAFMLARQINVLQLGDEVATGAGSHVERNRLLLLLISVALAASAVSVAGGIGFVGLIAPHMARKLAGANFRVILPVAVLLGAIVVVLADLAGRVLFLPMDVPAGVFTSAVGAPFFIYLLYSRRNAR